MVMVSMKEYARETVIKNLLSAHERIAKEGDSREIIRISKYVLRLTQNGQDKLFQLRTEEPDWSEPTTDEPTGYLFRNIVPDFTDNSGGKRNE